MHRDQINAEKPGEAAMVISIGVYKNQLPNTGTSKAIKLNSHNYSVFVLWPHTNGPVWFLTQFSSSLRLLHERAKRPVSYSKMPPCLMDNDELDYKSFPGKTRSRDSIIMVGEV